MWEAYKHSVRNRYRFFLTVPKMFSIIYIKEFCDGVCCLQFSLTYPRKVSDFLKDWNFRWGLYKFIYTVFIKDTCKIRGMERFEVKD